MTTIRDYTNKATLGLDDAVLIQEDDAGSGGDYKHGFLSALRDLLQANFTDATFSGQVYIGDNKAIFIKNSELADYPVIQRFGDDVYIDSYGTSTGSGDILLRPRSSSGVVTTALTLAAGGNATFSGDVEVQGQARLSGHSELTVSSGAITVTGSYHRIDTEGDAATDDVLTINGGTDGAILVLRSVSDTRDPIFKDGLGNLLLSGECRLNSVQDTLTLLYAATLGQWVEISRSVNA